MKLKSLVFGIVALAILMSPVLASEKEFAKGNKFLTPQIGLNSWAIPFGANFELAYTKNVGIGGTGMIWMWSNEYLKESVIWLSADVAYHFTKVKAEKLDLFGGGYVGFAIYSYSWKDEDFEDDDDVGSSNLTIGPFVGVRYYFNPKMALSVRIDGSLVGHWSTLGATVGLTLKLD